MTPSTSHPAPGAGSTSPSTTNPTHLQVTAKLFAESYSALLSIASDDPRLSLPADAGQILDGLERQLSRYTGPLTESAFLEWATSIILPQRGFYGIKRETERSVHCAIWRTLGHSTEPSKYDDNPEVVREIAQAVWLWVFQHIPELSEPGTAALTTRLYARAQITTRAWVKKQYTRRNAVIRQVYGLGSVRDAQEKARLLDTADRLRAEEREEIAEIHLGMEEAGIALNPD